MPTDRLALFALVLLLSATALAGGPRFVTGTTYTAAPPGIAMAFYTATPLYFTDPADLTSTVPHAQADAMVAAAAAVWNAPTSILTLAQGGSLAEHISAANAYFNGSSVVLPADASPSNYLAMPIAIVYDTDGSVTDLLLGADASDPSGCRHNGVTESVDGIGQDGTLQHAVIVLNGRCIAALPQSLTQLQYQLARAFGRILGLAWSQTNDNVFTGSPTPTLVQMNYWPLMHPLDVICGVYTYQCMNNPFTLRADDLSSLALLYPVTVANRVPGKTLSLQSANSFAGHILFPTAQGMEMANIALRLEQSGETVEEPWQVVSTVSGLLAQQNGGNPVSGPETPAENVGWDSSPQQGLFHIGRVPIHLVANIFFTPEPINPLYLGDYALGPYQREPETLSGPSQTAIDLSVTAGFAFEWNFTMQAGASTCNPGNDGSPTAPAPSDPTGWWQGQLCGTGHSSWWSATIKAGHSWTLESTALDEDGVVSERKAQTVLGVWNATDSTSALPTVAAAPTAMNYLVTGMTQLNVPAQSTNRTVTLVVADQFGQGRPDFFYQARILYADSVTPATVGSGGGLITIAGSGFRPGNQVLVNGVAAKVQSWTATQIVALAPTFTTAGSPSTSVSVTVVDPTTDGSTLIPSALLYTNATDVLQQVSAPTALETSIPSATPFAVRVLASDGLAPIPGASVRFAVTSGSAQLGCTPTCTLLTDSTGQARTTLTGLAAGTITVTATALASGATLQLTLTDTDPVRTVTLTPTTQFVAAGATASWSLTLQATQDAQPAADLPIAWTAAPGLTLTSQQANTGNNGTATIAVQSTTTPAAAQQFSACAWTTLCATWTLHGVDPSQWQLTAISGTGQSVPSSAQLAPVTLQVADAAGHTLQGATVTLYQTVTAWEGPCPTQGRCPAAPVLASSTTTATSDASGRITVTPLQLPTIPQAVNIAAATGTQGFVSLSLTKTP